VATAFQITIDCEDADRMCAFWSTALGYVEEPPPAGYLSWEDFLRANDINVPPNGSIGAIVDPDDIGPRLLFLRVPEKKQVKNRVHLDIRAGRNDDAKEAMIATLTAAGATEVRRVSENGQWWMVMADPEGNEFCVT
jgi:hypothetical protein